jgi:hypothetical protein
VGCPSGTTHEPAAGFVGGGLAGVSAATAIPAALTSAAIPIKLLMIRWYSFIWIFTKLVVGLGLNALFDDFLNTTQDTNGTE